MSFYCCLMVEVKNIFADDTSKVLGQNSMLKGVNRKWLSPNNT